MTTDTGTERKLIDAAFADVADTPARSTPPLPPPDAFAGYSIVREIHRGGQGVVYEAHQKSTDRRVAIKVQRDGAGSHGRARFEREVQILGQLRHPNIVTIHDSGETGGWSFYVMDYIDGRPVDEWVEAGPRTIGETLTVFGKIAAAVADAHLHGVIHRDLKPSNILIDEGGEPHILDFGLAKIETSDVTAMTMTGQFLGSLPWASPEQAEGRPERIDVRTDVYSLGVVLYEMLTGRFPYEVAGTMRQVLDNILRTEPKRPSTVRRQINDELETIVLKCLAKEPPRRYQGAGALAGDVRRYLAGEPIEAKRDSFGYVLRKTLVRRKWQVAAVLAVLVAGGTLQAMWARGQRLAEEEARAQVAVLIRSPWRNGELGETQQAEVGAIYAAFLGRLVDGSTDAQEREFYLPYLIDLEVETRDVIGLDDGWAAQLTMLPRHPLPDNHGVWVWFRQTYRLDGVEVLSFPGRLALKRTFYFWEKPTVDIAALLPDVTPAREVELESETVLHFLVEPALPGMFAPLSETPPGDALGTVRHRETRSVLILPRSPYPLAVTDDSVAARIDAEFRVRDVDLTTDDPARVVVTYSSGVEIPVVGRLELRDAASGAVVGQTSFKCLRSTDHTASLTSAEWRDADFVARVREGAVTSVVVRIVPDRDLAVKTGHLKSYFGLPIERTVPIVAR